MRMSDWSADVCSSDLRRARIPLIDEDQDEAALPDMPNQPAHPLPALLPHRSPGDLDEIRPEAVALAVVERSKARRVGTECVSTCRSRWSPHHLRQTIPTRITSVRQA